MLRMVVWLMGCLLVSGMVPALLLAADPPHLVAPTEAIPAREQAKMFHLPPGFEIQLIATEPEIRKPMNITFDARGRMYVTQSIEYPFPPGPDKAPRDTIRIFTDTDGNGVPDKSHVFADGLNIPIGVCVLPDGKVLAHNIPQISLFEDRDQDDKADHREPYYQQFGFRDTHGMASSFNHWVDGWVYATHGFANDSTVKGREGEQIQMNSGNTYRLRPDGKGIEYFTHGQVNPFGLAFDPLGNLYSSDCHTRPAYMLLRGAYYPSFGKPHDGLGYGPEMIFHDHGSTGIAGIIYYNADQFPADFQDNLLIGNPVTGKINRDKLAIHGSTYKAIEQPDFITCDDPWFRPVDLELAPDGSLYIADFYNCIIGHYEVPLLHPRRDREKGRIWRVVYTGKGVDGPAPNQRVIPDLTKVSDAELVALLGDTNLPVRVQSTHQAVRRLSEKSASQGLSDLVTQALAAQNPLQVAHASWVAQRSGNLQTGQLVKLMNHSDRTVRVHALKIAAEIPEWSDSAVLTAVRERLASDPDAFTRRAAAEALGRHPDLSNIGPLDEAWTATPDEDTHRKHVIRMALRDTLAGKSNLTVLVSQFASRPELLERLVEVSLGARTPAVGEFLVVWARTVPATHGRWGDVVAHAARTVEGPRIAEIQELLILSEKTPLEHQANLYRMLGRAVQERGQGLTDSRKAAALKIARELLAKYTEGQARLSVDLAKDLRLEPLTEDLKKLIPTPEVAAWRPILLEGLVALNAAQAIPFVEQLIRDPLANLELRQRAAEGLASFNDPAARQRIEPLFQSVSEQLAPYLARGLANTREGAELLLTLATTGKAAPRLVQDVVVNARLKAHNLPQLNERLEQILKDLPPEDEQLALLIATRRQGYGQATTTVEAGAEVFKKNCAACHRLGGQGNKIGPELDGIGLRGSERLLEDILNPNRNVDQSFRAVIIARTNGTVFSGLPLRKEGTVQILADDKGQEVRISAEEIEERRDVRLSPMPANFAEKLPPEELYHLLRFLLEQKKAPKKE